MTVSDERTPLLGEVVLLIPGQMVALPPEAPVPVAPISGDLWSGLTNAELIVLAQDPFWVRMRAITFWAFWVCWLALFVAAMSVAFTSPRCPQASCVNTTDVEDLNQTTFAPPTTVTLEAWTTLQMSR